MAQTTVFRGLIYRGPFTDNIDELLTDGIYTKQGATDPAYPDIVQGSILTVRRWDGNAVYQTVECYKGDKPIILQRRKKGSAWGDFYRLTDASWQIVGGGVEIVCHSAISAVSCSEGRWLRDGSDRSSIGYPAEGYLPTSLHAETFAGIASGRNVHAWDILHERAERHAPWSISMGSLGNLAVSVKRNGHSTLYASRRYEPEDIRSHVSHGRVGKLEDLRTGLYGDCGGFVVTDKRRKEAVA